MKRSSWGRDGAEEVDKSSFSRFLAELGRGSLARTDGGVAEEGGGMSHLFLGAELAVYCLEMLGGGVEKSGGGHALRDGI